MNSVNILMGSMLDIDAQFSPHMQELGFTFMSYYYRKISKDELYEKAITTKQLALNAINNIDADSTINNYSGYLKFELNELKKMTRSSIQHRLNSIDYLVCYLENEDSCLIDKMYKELETANHIMDICADKAIEIESKDI